MTAEQLMTEFNMTEDEIHEQLDITKFPGYFKQKISHPILNFNDFIHKMRKTLVLRKFFSHNNIEFAGIKEILRVFYEKMEASIKEEPSMADDLRMHMDEIHEVIMFQLYGEFFANQKPSQDEKAFQAKYLSLYCFTPAAFGIPANVDMDSPEMKFAWKLATRQLVKIHEAQTPRAKLLQIGKAIEIIQHSFDLCYSTQVTADDLVTLLPYLFV
jgi:hypothetical protein